MALCIKHVYNIEGILTESTEALMATWEAKNCNFSNNQVVRFVGFLLALPLGRGFFAFK